MSRENPKNIVGTKQTEALNKSIQHLLNQNNVIR